MQKITAELLGSGRILLDGKQVNLPFKQAEALVYYLLVEKETFRPKLADIIWGDSADEHKVQSNMRNAIYVIRREFGRDFLVGASKNVIQINPEIRIDLDIDRFNDKNLTDFSFTRATFSKTFISRTTNTTTNGCSTTASTIEGCCRSGSRSPSSRRFRTSATRTASWNARSSWRSTSLMSLAMSI